MHLETFATGMERTAQLGPGLPPVCRLGLATRGNTNLRRTDVEHAIESGLRYLNWCGKPDGMSRAVSGLGRHRKDVVVAVQFKSRTADEAEQEFDWILEHLGTDYLDIATLYYVESEAEWSEITGPDGAWEVLAAHKRCGTLKMIGLTSHQRELAAGWAAVSRPLSGVAASANADAVNTVAVNADSFGMRSFDKQYRLDLLMIRYNAAHRGAEKDVFPVTRKRSMPVVTFTGLRWRALLQATSECPEGFQPPSAAECYRFCLANPDVAVALAAPGDRSELEHALSLLADWRPPAPDSYDAMRAHGDRVRRTTGMFW